MELALEVGVGETGVSVSTSLPRVFSRAIIGSLLGKLPLIPLISSGKSGRAISQTLGIVMPTIRQHCGKIHGKIGTHSRLAIGLWAIRNGMVKSAVQPKSPALLLAITSRNPKFMSKSNTVSAALILSSSDEYRFRNTG